MTDIEFEQFWQKHRMDILRKDADYLRANGAYRLSSGADWLLFGIPIAAGIVFMEWCPVVSEILKWLLGAVVTIVCFAVCVWVKSCISTTESASDIEKRLKEEHRRQMTSDR